MKADSPVVTIDVSQSNEKYRDMAHSLVPYLKDLLRAINQLEEETFHKSMAIRAKKKKTIFQITIPYPKKNPLEKNIVLITWT